MANTRQQSPSSEELSFSHDNSPRNFPKDPVEKYSEEQIADGQDGLLDITQPFPDIPGLPDEGDQFTFRAVIVGIILGGVVSASNMYLCLKTGWTFGASLFGMSLTSLLNYD